MAIKLGSDFEQQLAALAGFEPGSYDEGSLSVEFINPAGPTTVRLGIRVDVDSGQLKALICDAAAPSDPGE